MRRWIGWIGLLVLGCTDDDPAGTGPEANTDTADTDTVVDDGWGHHAFSSATLPGCAEALLDDGTRGTPAIAYQTWMWDGEGDAELTVVLTHGRSEYTDKYHHVVRAAEDKPWNWVMWDAYGHGRTEGLRSHGEDFETQHVCDMEAVIAAAVDPSLPMHLVSHSTGGMINARYLQRHPGAAASAVMSSPLFRLGYGAFPESAVCFQADSFVSVGGIADPSSPFEPRGPCDAVENNATHDCEMYEEFAWDPLTEIGGATWGWLQQTCLTIPDLHDDVALITENVHIMQAGEETVVEPSGQDEFCTGMDAAPGTCTLTVYPGAFHELFRETMRADVIADTIRHIEANQP